jgi:hypothetical protein
MTESSTIAVHGVRIDAADPGLTRRALDEAFHYRGDVTLTLKPDGRRVEGYLFDRREGHDLASSCVRILPKDSDDRMTIAYDRIATIEFTGKDPAAGKTWENWVKRYVEKRQAGEKACIESEPLD